MTTGKRKPNAAFWLCSAVVVIVAIPPAYLLALGPIYWLRSHDCIAAEAWRACLLPLYYVDLCNSEHWFVRFLNDYLSWWDAVPL